MNYNKHEYVIIGLLLAHSSANELPVWTGRSFVGQGVSLSRICESGSHRLPASGPSCQRLGQLSEFISVKMFSRAGGGYRISFRNKTLDTNIDRQSVREAYNDVRNDQSESNWAVFEFQGNLICNKAVGVDFNEFCSQFSDDERAFGFIRVQVRSIITSF